ncbi:exosome complex protein Rrp4 [Candidatus Woesearchaeota archaeon]|nr:exosome complex protein Rrp4 [Candidatus Woesearchaeota archaeon]
MSELLIKERDIVVPGEVLARGMDYIPTSGTYREGEEIMASRVGLVHIDNKIIKLIPLSGKYHPKRNDIIIGEVVDVSINGWRVDTNSAYSAMLSVKDASSEFIARGADLTKYFDIGDRIVTKISNVTSQNLVDLTMRGPGLRKLISGRIIKVSPMKVPRIVGKQGSMVSMIKQMTNTKIIIGQNGVVWLQGEPEAEIIVVNTIRKIESESHLQGLTENIKQYLGTVTDGGAKDSTVEEMPVEGEQK